MNPAEYRAALPRAYDALIARHGGPNAVQLAAAPPILAGRDVLITAPTASGKTEAYLVPLVQRWLDREAGGPPRLLVVSPTRALVNDLARRLRERLARIGVEVGRWTGDHRDGGRLQALTVLTPEGLDSRLAREPAALARVGGLVLDELHVLDGTPRGDQLRILVERLRRERGEGAPPLQVVAASATVPDPPGVAGRYLREAAIVDVGGHRPIRVRIVRGTALVQVEAELRRELERGFRKVLLFCNSRAETEETAAFFRGRRLFSGAVVAHHGSLSRTVRLEAERRFLGAPVALCVATSTLEVGLDIGDVDLVVLLGAPPDVASLAQRAGRGGRRRPHNHVLAFVSGAFEEAVLRVLLRGWRAGDWYPPPDAFRAGVLVQQALSVLHARHSRTVDAAALARRLPPDLAAEWDAPRLERVLAAAAKAGWLVRVPVGEGRVVYRVGERAEGPWRRGSLHGNIEGDVGGVEVVDRLTGVTLGQVPRSDGPIVLGGRARATRVVAAGKVVADPGRRPLEGRPSFGRGSAFPVPASLATAALAGAGIPHPSRVRVPDQGIVILFHGLGRLGGRVLAAALRFARAVGHGRGQVLRAGPYAVVLSGGADPRAAGPTSPEALAGGGSGAGPDWRRWPGPAVAEAALRAGHDKLLAGAGLGRFHAVLPEPERLAVAERLADLDAVRRLLAAGPPPEVEPPDEAAVFELWIEAAWA